MCVLLESRYGKSKAEKRYEYTNLKQKAREDIREYYDRFCKAGMGLGIDEEDQIIDFANGISDEQVYVAVQTAAPMIKTLQEALQCAMRVSHRKATRSTLPRPSTTTPHKNPNITCNKCGQKGHISRTCPNNKKVSELAEVNEAQADSGVDEEGSDVDIYEVGEDDEEVDIEEKRTRENDDAAQG